jgi:outer membrane protein assembly factor BamE (lipoprotein component of BamABCDE complex)
MKAKILILLLVILAILTALFSWSFYTRIKMDYNSEGTYLDKDSLVVYNEQAQIVYGLITLILIILTLLTTLKLKSIFKNL